MQILMKFKKKKRIKRKRKRIKFILNKKAIVGSIGCKVSVENEIKENGFSLQKQNFDEIQKKKKKVEIYK